MIKYITRADGTMRRRVRWYEHIVVGGLVVVGIGCLGMVLLSIYLLVTGMSLGILEEDIMGAQKQKCLFVDQLMKDMEKYV